MYDSEDRSARRSSAADQKGSTWKEQWQGHGQTRFFRQQSLPAASAHRAGVRLHTRVLQVHKEEAFTQGRVYNANPGHNDPDGCGANATVESLARDNTLCE